MIFPSRMMKICLGVLAVSLVASCGLPRSGPNREEVVALPTEETGGLPFNAIIVSPEVAAMTRVDESSGFDVSLIDASREPTQLIAVGDVMAITVWENIDEGLLNPQGIGASQLPQSVVDERGMIFVPYVGLIPAAGRTINTVRETIQSRLAEKTLNPQVDIYPVDKAGRLVSVQGSVNAPGLYPIEKPTRYLLPMLARAGGISEDPQTTRIKIRRGRLVGEISVEDLYDNPANNIPVRSGDAIVAERDRRVFTALGAISGQQSVPFPERDVTVVRALGLVGGLLDERADPTGLFIFRKERPEIANRLVPGSNFTEPTPIAYVFDLTKPGALFVAGDFMMRDDDTMYVTTAPYVRWMKIMQAISPVVGFGGSVRSLGGF
ncbi:polysaccharide export protein [Rhodobacteraceae bacterium NNCM2]|nr:polysaccharide export protein [Coraliihabitans acroporae]